jgi:hypothetical protein
VADNRNISSLVNTNTLNTLSSVNAPKSFGDQISNNSEKIINSSLGKKQQLQFDFDKLVSDEIEENVKYAKTLKQKIRSWLHPVITEWIGFNLYYLPFYFFYVLFYVILFAHVVM